MIGTRLLLAAVGLLSLPSQARASDEDVFGSGAQRVDDGDLSEQRGGFVWEGVDIRFGAELRSYVNDELVIQTNISMANQIPQVTTVLGSGVAAMTPAELQGVLGANGLGTQLGLGGGYMTADGRTSFIQRIDGAIQNVIVNTANNTEIRQQLDITLDLGNFEAFQSGIMAGQLGNSAGMLIGLAGIGR